MGFINSSFILRNTARVLKTQLAMAMRQPDQGRALTKEIYEGSQRIRKLEEKLDEEYPEFRSQTASAGGLKQTKMADFTTSGGGKGNR